MSNLRRFLFLGIVFALLLPVLACSAFASEVYTFYWFELPAALSDPFDFFPDEEGFYFSYDGLLPEGEYIVSFDVQLYGGQYQLTSDPVRIVYEVSEEGYCFSYSEVLFSVNGPEQSFSQAVYQVSVVFSDDTTILAVISGDSYLASFASSHASLTSVNDSGGTLGTVLESLDTISEVVGDTFTLIISNPALTVTTGGGLTGVGVLVYKRLRRGV